MFRQVGIPRENGIEDRSVIVEAFGGDGGPLPLAQGGQALGQNQRGVKGGKGLAHGGTELAGIHLNSEA